jgi:hypothetical protein
MMTQPTTVRLRTSLEKTLHSFFVSKIHSSGLYLRFTSILSSWLSLYLLGTSLNRIADLERHIRNSKASMTVPFGFSVGDVIAGIGVVKRAIDAFHNTRGASKDYQRLSHALQTLSESLAIVSAIPLDPQHDTQQTAAIAGGVHRCQQTLDSFLERATKFELLEETDQSRGWREKVVAATRKVQWAVCEKGDVTKFTRDVHHQIEEIGLLIATLQV